MLYPTLNQPLVLLIIFLVGIFCGLVFDVAKILTTLSGGDQWSRHIFDFFATLLSFGAIFFANLKINFGQFRIYVLIVFLFSFALQRFFSKILWTKLLRKWYTSITKKKGERLEKRKVGKHSVVGGTCDTSTASDNNINNTSRQTPET